MSSLGSLYKSDMDFEALHLLANVAVAIADQRSLSLSLIPYKEKKNDKKKKKKKKKLQAKYSSWSLCVSDSSNFKLTFKKKPDNELAVPSVPMKRQRSTMTRKPSSCWFNGNAVVAAAGIKRSFSQIEIPLQDRQGGNLKKMRTLPNDVLKDSLEDSDDESTVTVLG